MTSMMEERTYNICNFNNLSFPLNEHNFKPKTKEESRRGKGCAPEQSS